MQKGNEFEGEHETLDVHKEVEREVNYFMVNYNLTLLKMKSDLKELKGQHEKTLQNLSSWVGEAKKEQEKAHDTIQDETHNDFFPSLVTSKY